MSSGYTPTIGLEIHAELKTATKMFCNSRNDPDEERPNFNVCPVCMAFPGTLPVVNRTAVNHVLKVGAALNGELADYTEFDRKNYFYPDIPKGYQISQYEYPLVTGGELAGVAITRVHLEEDTANSKHVGEHSLIDFNRAGIPLMELVTEPVIHDAVTASTFAKELQLLLRTLGVGEANMEKGQMRVEVNISVSKTDTFGTKVEVKNINSFKSVERAIAYEIERQVQVLEEGGVIVQETRGFDENKGVTFSQRAKESSHDYRYFPDPDIPKFRLSLVDEFANVKNVLPELPWVRRARLLEQGIAKDSVEVILGEPTYAEIYETAIEGMDDAKAKTIAANILFGPVRGMGLSVDVLRTLAASLPGTATMIARGALSSTAGIALIQEILENGGTPEEVAAKKGLLQVTDLGALEQLVDAVIAENQAAADEVRSGKEAAIQYLIGQGMKKSKGSAKPDLLKDIIHKKLKQ